MLKQLDEVYICSQQTCESIPRANVRLASGFMEAYEEFVKNNAPVVGGFSHVLFDGSCARFSGRSETVVANDGFLRASKLVEFYVALREYQRIFNGLYEDRTKRQKLAIAKSLKQGDDSVIRELDDRLLRSGLEESDRILVKKFLTQYDWWHGQKTVDRDDFVNSPLLQCAKLVAASNGAIPCITQHLGENVALMEAFGFSVDSDLCIRREGFVDNLSLEQLADELKEMVSDDVTKSSGYRILGLKYPKSISKVRREDLLAKAGLNESYEVEIHKGIKLHELIAAKKWGLSFADNVKQIPEQPKESDRLTVALKLFKEARKATASTSVRCWVFSPGEQANRWDEMRDGGVMALSYSECGRDLREYANEEAIRAEFKSSEEDDASYKNHVRALSDFLNVMKPGDLVFAKKGTKTFLGVGRVTGEYEFVANAQDYKHRRAVEWLKTETVERDDAVARKTLTDVTRYGDLVRELCEAYGVEESTNHDQTDCACRMVCEVDSKYDDYARQTRKMFCDIDGAKLVAIDWNDFCSHHFNSSQAVTHFRDYDDNSKALLGNWLKDVRENPLDIAHELERMPKLVGLGTGGTISCMFLMKASPTNFCSYAGQGHDSLVFLGLETQAKIPDFSLECYYHHKELQARVLKEMVRLGIGREDGQKADYITVNEFLWWVDDHKDLIKEKVMESKYKPTEIKKVTQKEIKDFSKFIDQLEKDVENAGLKYAQNLLKRFVCAQLAKPFVVLTGLSGSGKTKLAEAFTKWIGVENTVNVVPVGADWTNNEKLLGYPNALDPEKYVMPDTGVLKLMLDANENPDLPFFLILDEMNLSHVERYFADFLSTMESNDGIIELYDSGKRYAEDGREIPPSFKFPKNLFVIGTMNVDETTYMFSPKVLDRAQVIEFRVSEDDMKGFLGNPSNPKIDDLAGKGAAYAKAFLDLAAERKTKQPTGDELTNVKNALADVFPSLAELGAEFGYRSAIEILTFVAYYLEASGYKKLTGSQQKDCLKAAIDAGMLQKLLPKLHGSLNRLGPVLDALIGKVSKAKPQTDDADSKQEIEKFYPLTYEKLQRMKLRVEKNGFTSFAEA